MDWSAPIARKRPGAALSPSWFPVARARTAADDASPTSPPLAVPRVLGGRVPQTAAGRAGSRTRPRSSRSPATRTPHATRCRSRCHLSQSALGRAGNRCHLTDGSPRRRRGARCVRQRRTSHCYAPGARCFGGRGHCGGAAPHRVCRRFDVGQPPRKPRANNSPARSGGQHGPAGPPVACERRRPWRRSSPSGGDAARARYGASRRSTGRQCRPAW
jgi:hypothetical protein